MWRGPGTGPLPRSQRDSGDVPLSPKKMYVALGGAGGKVTYREHGERRVRVKQTDWGKHIRSLSQQPVGYMMHEHYLALRDC